MIADIHTVPDGAALEADLCIIGAGAAGIVLAREFLHSSLKVILLESGGFRRDTRVQSLYSGDSIGETYYQELHECRTRCFGGSTNCWAGICTPLNSIDFEARPWVPWSGWPVNSAELEPYLRRAHGICGRGPFLYDSRAWKLMRLPAGDFRPDRFQQFVWHFNNRDGGYRFGKRFRQELRGASNIHVFLHANATALVTDQSGRSVEQAVVRTFDGRTARVRAKIFVLASGAIENARILLASTSHYPSGLGNHRDLVGRFFQEHLQVPCGFLHVADPRSPAVQYSRLSKMGSAYCLPGLSLAPEMQKAHQTLNGSIAVDPFYDSEGAWIAFQKLRSDWKNGRLRGLAFRRLWTVVRDSPTLAPIAWRRLVHGERARGDSHRFVIYARAEQAPNPESRVFLTEERDPLGMRRACLDWRTSPLDRKAIRLMASLAAAEFTRVGLGHVTQAPWLSGEAWPADLVGGPHHMGTTRMSDDDSSGVVDRNCRVHGLDGLYLAGSSVFPTGGHANPTLTILALTLRLAEHLRSVFGDWSAASANSRGTRLQPDSQVPVVSEMP